VGRRRGTRRRSRTHRGEDLFVQVSLEFEEAAFGMTKEISVDTLETCSRCAGTGCEPGTHPSRCTRCGGSGELQDVSRSVFGTVMTARPCTTCEGTGEEIAVPCVECRGEGRITVRQTRTLEVPAGVADGMELRVAGGGQDGRQGGAAGDLYVALKVRPHPTFERRGQDLTCALSIPMSQAALGTDVEVPTLDGEPERIRIEPGTASGTVIRLRGRGLPHLGRRSRGDLFVTVDVETPVPGSKQERALLEQLADLRGEKPAGGRRSTGKLRRLLEK
jgi:molecular chaperone DnaJ